MIKFRRIKAVTMSVVKSSSIRLSLRQQHLKCDSPMAQQIALLLIGSSPKRSKWKLPAHRSWIQANSKRPHKWKLPTIYRLPKWKSKDPNFLLSIKIWPTLRRERSHLLMLKEVVRLQSQQRVIWNQGPRAKEASRSLARCISQMTSQEEEVPHQRVQKLVELWACWLIIV